MTARLQSLVAWSAVTVALASALALGGNRPPAWIGLAVASTLLLVLQLVCDARDPARPDRLRAVTGPAVLFLVVLAWAGLQATSGWAPAAWVHPAWHHVGAAAAIAVDPGAAAHHLARLLAYAALFWIAWRAAEDRRRAYRLVRAIALFSTGLALYGLVTAAVDTNPITAVAGGSAGPLTASFVNRNSYATYAAFGLFANLAAWFRVMERADLDAAAATDRQRLRRALTSFFGGRGWWFALGAFLCGLALLLTQSRAGAGAALVGTVAMLAAYRGGGWVGRTAVAAAVVAGGFLAFTAAGGVTERLLATGAESARFAIYGDLVEAIAARPVLGYGLGGFEDGFRPFVPYAAATAEWDLAHSSYLENLFELGVPAAMLYYGALAWLARRVWLGTRTRRRDRALPALALAATVTAALHATVDFSLQMPATAALFATILGIGWAQSFGSSGPEDGRRRERPHRAAARAGLTQRSAPIQSSVITHARRI